MGEAVELTNQNDLSVVTFGFSLIGITIAVPSKQSFTESSLILEHTSSGRTWQCERLLESGAGEHWVAPFKFLELSGSYQFRYVDTVTGSSRVLGKELAQSVKSDAQRFIQTTFFQRAGELFDAEIYIPYTKKSARLRVRKAFEHAKGQKKLEHLVVKSILQKDDELRIAGSAFVPGVPSLKLRPFLILRNETGEEVLRVEGQRKRSMGNQNRYGFADCDYTDSGYLFCLPKQHFSDERLKAPSRLKVCVALVSSEGVEYEKTPIVTPASLGFKLRTFASLKTLGSRNIVSLISAATNDELFITHRIEEEILSRFNKLKRMLAYKLFDFLGKPQSKAWLLYEFEASAAQDNGLALFEALKRSRKDLDVKYIIDTRHADAKKLKGYGWSVIRKYSFRHYWSLLTAQILISSQSRYHGYRLAPPKNDPIGREMAKKPFVFLQHGVIALKKISFHRSNPRVAADLFFSSTKLEQEIICREFGYESAEVPLIGLPRFDKLVDKSGEFNEILVMPTWRKWLQRSNRHSFLGSEFFRNYITFLKSSDLAELCQRERVLLKLYLHPMIAKNIDCFTDLPAHVQVVSNGQEPINELMMKARMLVTDYSSVAWDFMYMKKPVAFFHFDLPKYEQVHGAYFDLKQGLGRASVQKPSELVSLLKEWLDGDGWSGPAINQFEHIDKNNCSRAIEVIEGYLAKP